MAELGEIDSGPQFPELSMRVNVDEDPVGAEQQLDKTVRDDGLEIAAGQQTKTSIVLKHVATAAAGAQATSRLLQTEAAGHDGGLVRA